MSKLTAQQILKIIEENYSESDFAYNDWLDTDKVEVPSEYVVLLIGNISLQKVWVGAEEAIKPKDNPIPKSSAMYNICCFIDLC